MMRTERHLVRIGAVAAIGGALLLSVATGMHPSGADPADPAAAFERVFAGNGLSGAVDTFTITNRVTCDAELTLVKEVHNGDALASAWELSATATGGGRG